MSSLDEGHATGDPLYRLHSLLVDAVRHRRGRDAQQGPVTVAEIYQELVPYRHVRAALGLELNADYEHTLLRLLAGEEQLARLEPETAREQLARELESANPNVTLYRKYAACDVWLLQSALAAAPAWLDEHLSDEAGPIGSAHVDAGQSDVDDGFVAEEYLEDEFAPEAPFDGRASATGAGMQGDAPAARGTRPPGYVGRTFTVAEDVADDEELEATLARALGTESSRPEGQGDGDTSFEEEEPASPGGDRNTAGEPASVGPDGRAEVTSLHRVVDAQAEARVTDAVGNQRPGYCMFCDSALPRGRAARYCPYCGADQEQRPCSACGEAVEPGWAFCIACGTPADAAGA